MWTRRASMDGGIIAISEASVSQPSRPNAYTPSGSPAHMALLGLSFSRSFLAACLRPTTCCRGYNECPITLKTPPLSTESRFSVPITKTEQEEDHMARARPDYRCTIRRLAHILIILATPSMCASHQSVSPRPDRSIHPCFPDNPPFRQSSLTPQRKNRTQYSSHPFNPSASSSSHDNPSQTSPAYPPP